MLPEGDGCSAVGCTCWTRSKSTFIGHMVNKAPRISRPGSINIRCALFMPELVAIQRDEAVRAFYGRLVQHGKQKMKANVAVMRKLLHAIYGVFKSNSAFDATKCFPAPIPAGNP